MFMYGFKSEEKGKIFRPWDNAAAGGVSQQFDNSQDCTVSTTTQEEDEEVVEVVEQDIKLEEPKPSTKKHKPLISRRKLSINESKSTTTSSDDDRLQPTGMTPQFPIEHPLDPYNPLYPEMLQANLAQTLGLTPNDPLFLESMAHGYALEEYARVLSQEHQAKILAAKKQRPKKYKCPHCNVGFSNNGQLKGHIRIHTGERPFKCDAKECGKTFTRNEELTRHKRIHSGLRPFPCSHCGKRFGRKDHLKKHCRTHMQPRGLYAVPVMMPFDAWASGQTGAYPFVPMLY